MIISTFKSVRKAYVKSKLDISWDEIADLLLQHNKANSKTDVELYNMAEFKDLSDPTVEWGRKYHYVGGVRQDTYDLIPNTVRRCKENVLSISGIVLDVDEHQTIPEIYEILDGIEYVLYTTFRHTPEKHKFRVAIPFSRPLLKDDIVGRQQSIKDTFPGVDNASFTMSQSFYFHSGNTDPIAYRNHGVMIDPYDFAYTPPEVFQPSEYHSETTLDDEHMEAYKQNVVKSLLSCSGLHYAGVGDNNLGVLTLVSICKSIGLNFNEYDSICSQIASSDSTLKSPENRRNAWTGWNGDKIRKETRDKFIKAYNGIPLNSLPLSDKTATRLEIVREKLRRLNGAN